MFLSASCSAVPGLPLDAAVFPLKSWYHVDTVNLSTCVPSGLTVNSFGRDHLLLAS